MLDNEGMMPVISEYVVAYLAMNACAKFVVGVTACYRVIRHLLQLRYVIRRHVDTRTNNDFIICLVL